MSSIEVNKAFEQVVSSDFLDAKNNVNRQSCCFLTGLSKKITCKKLTEAAHVGFIESLIKFHEDNEGKMSIFVRGSQTNTEIGLIMNVIADKIIVKVDFKKGDHGKFLLFVKTFYDEILGDVIEL